MPESTSDLDAALAAVDAQTSAPAESILHPDDTAAVAIAEALDLEAQAAAEQAAVEVLINAPRPVPSQELLAGVADVEVKVAGHETARLFSVKFQANVGAYNPGEIAGFEQHVAEKLIADGFATANEE